MSRKRPIEPCSGTMETGPCFLPGLPGRHSIPKPVELCVSLQIALRLQEFSWKRNQHAFGRSGPRPIRPLLVLAFFQRTEINWDSLHPEA